MTRQSSPAPGVSVVVPVYRTEASLPACLDSLLKQNCDNFEIIVVDDASPGTCSKIVRAYQQKSGRIRHIRHERNRGLLAARLTGVLHSRSEYIAFMDSDDTARPNFLSTLLASAKSTGAEIVGSAVNENQTESFTLAGAEKVTDALCNGKIPNMSVVTKLFTRRLFEDSPELIDYARENHIIRSEDRVICLALCTKCRIFSQVGSLLFNYDRGRVDSSTQDVRLDSIRKDISDLIGNLRFLSRILSQTNYRRVVAQMTLFLCNDKLMRISEAERAAIIEDLKVMAREPAGLDLIASLYSSTAQVADRARQRHDQRKEQVERIRERTDQLLERVKLLEANSRKLRSQLTLAREAHTERVQKVVKRNGRLAAQVQALRRRMHQREEAQKTPHTKQAEGSGLSVEATEPSE